MIQAQNGLQKLIERKYLFEMRFTLEKAALSIAGIALALPLTSACSSDDEQASNQESNAASASPAAAESSSEDIEVTEGQVPDIEGRTHFEAITALREAGLRYEAPGDDFDMEEDSQNTRDWTVTGQSPVSGAEAKAKDVVEVTVERGG